MKLFCYVTKKSRQKFKYLENEKSFWGEIKIIFHQFWRAFNCQKLFKTWECALKLLSGSLYLQFELPKWVLDYCKTERYCSIESFLLLSNITLLFSFYVRCLSNILKLLQNVLKLAFLFYNFWYIFSIAFISNKVFYFSQVSMAIACYLSKIYLQSGSKAWI